MPGSEATGLSTSCHQRRESVCTHQSYKRIRDHTMPKNPRIKRFALEFKRCAICHDCEPYCPLQTHHIVGGAGRKHDRQNLLRLCEDCHTVLHSGTYLTGLPDVTKGMILTAKQEEDPENYDPVFLAGLVHKKWLGYDPEPLSDFYLEQRRKNQWKNRSRARSSQPPDQTP